MSRAFVNEDNFVEDLQDRPISEQPNLVTEQGLALIEGACRRRCCGIGRKLCGDQFTLARKPARIVRLWLSVSIRSSMRPTC